MLKRRRFVQITDNAKGIRAMVAIKDGVELVIRGLPEREANVAKRVVGIANVAKSLAVKR